MKQYTPLLFLLSCLIPVTPVFAAELTTLKNATLVTVGPGQVDSNDGDSFMVRLGEHDHRLRLYYVDCPETTYNNKADQERILEQQRHFGLGDPHAVIRLGRRAAEYVDRVLSRPFTVHTSYASAPGRSASGRIYAFIETHDGQDLGRLLVAQGLARIHGKTRPAPDGTPSHLVLQSLEDLEDTALLNRAGIWAESDPALLADMRRRQREEEQAAREFARTLKEKDTPTPENPIDLNSASKRELERLPGVGPVLAAKIAAARPYHDTADLLNIPGIGQKKFADIAPRVKIGVAR